MATHIGRKRTYDRSERSCYGNCGFAAALVARRLQGTAMRFNLQIALVVSLAGLVFWTAAVALFPEQRWLWGVAAIWHGLLAALVWGDTRMRYRRPPPRLIGMGR